MDPIKTGIRFTQTIRNVARLREIVTIFARHGFAEFVAHGGVSAYLPNFVLPSAKKTIKEEMGERGERDWGHIIGSRLRLCFEELGPAFIKFGQLLCSREDIFDDGFIAEMRLLRDQVKPISFRDVQESVEEALGQSIEKIFSHIDQEPIGTASIGVVYKAILLNGEEVIVKVRRPGIERAMETDFSIILFLTGQAERFSEEIQFLGVSRMVRDFAATLESELNFNIEALNCERLKQNSAKHDPEGTFYMPQVHRELTRENVLVAEFLKGTKFSNHEEMSLKKEKVLPLLDKGVAVFIKTFLSDGFFHADLHGGNLFLLEDETRIGVVDFGLVGTLGKRGRQSFIAIVYSLVTHNYENLVYEFLDVAEYDHPPDMDVLIGDVRSALTPYVGLTIQQTNFSDLFQSILQALKKHRIYLPREWFIVFRALMTLDGVGKSLNYDLDVFALLQKDIGNLVKQSISKEELMEEGFWAGRDMIGMLRLLPRHAKWFLRSFSRGGYAFEIRHLGIEQPVSRLTSSMEFLGFSFLAGIFIFSGAFLLDTSVVPSFRAIPPIVWAFWSLGLICFARAWLATKRN
jgi:ubiquinone biosynthesis protein